MVRRGGRFLLSLHLEGGSAGLKEEVRGFRSSPFRMKSMPPPPPPPATPATLIAVMGLRNC